MSGALIRRWEARAPEAAIDAWLDGYRERVLPKMKTFDGFRGVKIHVSRGADPRTVTVLTAWDGEEAMERFVGPDHAKAVMPDWVAELMPDHDSFATHYDEVLSEEL